MQWINHLGPKKNHFFLYDHGCYFQVWIQFILLLGVNFTNVLQAAFTRVDPKNAKTDSQLKQLFWAFGICARKSCSLKLTPGLFHGFVNAWSWFRGSLPGFGWRIGDKKSTTRGRRRATQQVLWIESKSNLKQDRFETGFMTATNMFKFFCWLGQMC